MFKASRFILSLICFIFIIYLFAFFAVQRVGKLNSKRKPYTLRRSNAKAPTANNPIFPSDSKQIKPETAPSIDFLTRLKSSEAYQQIPYFSRSQDAVIMFVRESKVYLPCHKERIKHLIHTTNELKYDVYIFINAHSKDRTTTTISSEEQKVIKSKFRDPLLDLPNVYFVFWTADGLKELLPNFLEISGGSKRYTALWMMKNEYRYVWHLESDIFFTGNWSNLFDAYTSNHADILTRKSARASEIGIVFRRSPYALKNREFAEKVAWPVIRLSSSFMKVLLPILQTEKMHHEVIATVCNLLGTGSCNIDYFHETHVSGHYSLGRFGIYKKPISCCEFGKEYYDPEKPLPLDFRIDNIQPNALYHPFKCIATNTSSPHWLPSQIDRWYEKT